MSWLGGLASCAINPVPQASWSGWPQLGCLRRPLCRPSWHKDISLYVSAVPILYNSDFLSAKTLFWRERCASREILHKQRLLHVFSQGGQTVAGYAQIKKF